VEKTLDTPNFSSCSFNRDFSLYILPRSPHRDQIIWKNEDLERKYKGTSCQLKEFEEMERKLFEKENPTMLDAAKIVIEKEGEKVGEFINHYGKISFFASSS